METNNGKKGGLLKGKPHYDKSGKSLGGIKAVVTDSGQQVELEGGEVIINKEASKKHWKELSRINQSAGNGVPILPPDDTDTDIDTDEYEKGGKIDFNPNKVPSKKIYNYAKKIKEKYPKVWDVGGNIFGNEAYKNLERVLKRGYWLDSEEWMYKKWQSFNARHSGDIRIAGIIANLKWLNVVDKGWQYMTNLIDEEIDKKYGDNKMAKGGKTEILSPQGTLLSKDKKSKLDYKKVGDNYEFSVFDGEANPVENYTRTQFKKRNENNVVMPYQQFVNFLYEKGFIDNKMAKGGVVTYKEKYNKKYGYKPNESHNLNEVSKDTGVSKKGVQQIYNKGIGAYKTNPESVRPNVKSKEQWAMARVYSSVMGGKASRVDANELKMARGGYTNQKITCENCGWTWNTKDSAEFDKYICHNCGFDNSGFYAKGGELAKGIKVEKEHSKTANKLYNRKITPQQSFEEIAKDHLKEDKNYYSKLAVFENKMADGGNIDVSKFGFKTPTGKPSKLTYMQQILVRTKAFKEWFGDWEAVGKEVIAKDLLNENTSDDVLFGMYKDCSKVVDFETLEPRLVYHGTPKEDEFYEFNTEIRATGRPYSYFAYNKAYSENFKLDEDEKDSVGYSQNWSGIYDCFVSVKRPLVMLGKLFENVAYDGKNWMFFLVNVIFRDTYKRQIDNKKDAEFITNMIDEIGYYVYAVSQANFDNFKFWKLMAYDGNGDFKMFLQKYGYDSVIYTEEIGMFYDPYNPAQYTKAVTIFESNQVKLGDGRNVDFSSSTNDIRYKKGGVTKAPVKTNDKSYHYSLAKAVFGDGGQIETNEVLDINGGRNLSNRQYVESLINKLK